MSAYTWHILRDGQGKPVMGKLVRGPSVIGREACEEDERGRHSCFVIARSLRQALDLVKERHKDHAPWIDDRPGPEVMVRR